MALLTLWKTRNSRRSLQLTKILSGALIGLWALLSACVSSPLIAAENLEEPATHGRILLWHSWNDEDSAALDLALRQFREANPGSKILSVAVPPEELFDQYVTSAPQGLGPDILIGSSEWVQPLAQAGLIRPLPATPQQTGQFLPQALLALTVDEQLYGRPLALEVDALFYNRALTRRPAATLDELMAQLEDQAVFAMAPDFGTAYWGIQNFGEGLFATEGILSLQASGLAEWLAWLTEAQDQAGLILNRDRAALRQAFLEGRIAYYVAGPDELPALLEGLGEADLGVTTLPNSEGGMSGPLLEVESLYLSAYSSAGQAELARAAALFLTNAEQNRTFMRLANRIPANRLVQVDGRVYPFIAGFAQQSARAAALPNGIDQRALFELGDQAYANVLGGVQTPEESVCRLGLELAAREDFGLERVDLPEGCTSQPDNPAAP